MVQFLEGVPPGELVLVLDIIVENPVLFGNALRLNVPDIQLPCLSQSCGGVRTFAYTGPEVSAFDNVIRIFLDYCCRNCNTSRKLFSLLIDRQNCTSGPNSFAVKVGEFPPFNSRFDNDDFRSFVGIEDSILNKAMWSENLGLGVGAFAYYRRIVETQKTRIIREMARAAATLGAGADAVTELERLANHPQFSRALAEVKQAIPDQLMINGENPLKLLHGILSIGVHTLSDEACLQYASAVRTLLWKCVCGYMTS
jgi:hypothetical protein